MAAILPEPHDSVEIAARRKQSKTEEKRSATHTEFTRSLIHRIQLLCDEADASPISIGEIPPIHVVNFCSPV